jgi:hypothetical protein
MGRRLLIPALVVLLIGIVCGTGWAGRTVTYDLTGAWTDKARTTSLTLKQSGTTLTWRGGPNNRAWIQNFTGTLSGSGFSGTFRQDAPGVSPQRYHGTMTAVVIDSCHFRFTSIVQAGWPTLKDIEFEKLPCTSAVAAPTWPRLPDALVALNDVSNGCGGGAAGNDPKYGDDSDFVDSEIPFADAASWKRSKKYHVNFREACKQHDAGYSGAKVRDMPLNGAKVIDYFTWTKTAIDEKFLVDMRMICDDQIPKTAIVALTNCKQNGGFHLVSGAKSRYNIVAKAGFLFWKGRPKLGGTWAVGGLRGSSSWTVTQNIRQVKVAWSGGAGQPNLRGEFRGTLISNDDDTTVKGFYVVTDSGRPKRPAAMRLSWTPKTPNELRVTGPGGTFALAR